MSVSAPSQPLLALKERIDNTQVAVRESESLGGHALSIHAIIMLLDV